MIRALVEKELRQHGSMIVLFLILINSGMMILQSNTTLAISGGSAFFLLSWMLFTVLPLGCLVLGNALIAAEFRQKTQVFLDGLPLQRWKMVAVKYLFGLAVTQLSAMLLAGTMLVSAWRSEALNSTFLSLIVVKTISWSWFCWAAVFALSFLGRYRLFIGLAVVLGLMWADQACGVLVNRFGPFELIGERFAYERYEYPVNELWMTGGLIAALTILGFLLALVRDATLATMLSEEMSSREKLVVISLGVAGLMIVGSTAERVERTDPLDLPDSIDIELGPVTVSAAAAVSQPTADEGIALRAHADSAAAILREVTDYLKIQKLPPLFLVHRRDFTSNEFQDGDLASRQGYLLRINMLKTPASSSVLRSRIIGRLLNVNQHDRLNSDSRGWILHGFAYWWPRKATSDFSDSLTAEARQEFHETELTEKDLVQWKRFRKSRGEDFDEGMTASVGIESIWQQDAQLCREFLSKTLGYSAPHDVRASIHDWWYSTPYLVKTVLKTDLRDLALKWNNVLHSDEPYRLEAISQ
jgi:hypothetical protein